MIVAPARYEQIPFPVKALKLLLKDLQALSGNKKSGWKGMDAEIEEDDGVSFFLPLQFPPFSFHFFHYQLPLIQGFYSPLPYIQGE
jgi:hypothetical protein